MPAPWFSVATHFKGLSEVHGSVNNPQIVEMFKVSAHAEIKDDETPWCAAFVGGCLRLSGYASSGSVGARSYRTFGDDLKQEPRRGCIVVFWRGSPTSETGHVAFFDHDDGDNVAVLGGNQGDSVAIAKFPKSRVLAYRWPTVTAPLPTNTILPNILTIDPTTAPPHVLLGTTPVGGLMPAPSAGALAEGAQGREVVALQTALAAQGFQPGTIDGEFGPLTGTAVANFQRARSLAATGTADPATLNALGLAQAETAAAPLAGSTGSTTMQPQDLLKIVLDALVAGKQAGAAPVSPTPVASAASPIDISQVLQVAIAALAGRPVAGAVMPSPGASSGPAPPVLSAIDKVLGGEALAGKKTMLSVVAYVILAILQAVGVAGTATGATATPTGSILTTLIGAFGALGGLSKIDRVVQSLGMIASQVTAPQK